MHDEIIKYSMSGVISDGNILERRDRMVLFLENQMRENGCAPSLDLDPQFTWEYNIKENTWSFEISVYGSFVGRREAWETSGVTNGTRITKSTRKPKSKESSTTAE